MKRLLLILLMIWPYALGFLAIVENEEGLTAIKQRLKCDKIYIDAQKHAIGFYEKFGFKVTSEEFLEEGIIHVAMELESR